MSGPYPDPKEEDDKLVVVDLKPRERLKRPETLAEVKGLSELRDFDLIRIGRLSVMPMSQERWKRLMRMGDGK